MAAQARALILMTYSTLPHHVSQCPWAVVCTLEILISSVEGRCSPSRVRYYNIYTRIYVTPCDILSVTVVVLPYKCHA